MNEASEKRVVYFAHPINTYDTPLESELLQLVATKWKGDTVLNPGNTAHKDAVKFLKAKDPDANVMGYFLELVRKCANIVVLPFGDGKWGAGVWAEAEEALKEGAFVWIINPVTRVITFVPKLDPALKLSVEETRARVYFPDRTIRPYV